MKQDFTAMLREVLASVDSGSALRENALRRKVAVEFEAARKAKGWSIRTLAKKMNTSLSQVQRLTHKELGGSLTLRTVMRAAHVLDLSVNLDVSSLSIVEKAASLGAWQEGPSPQQGAKIFRLPTVAPPIHQAWVNGGHSLPPRAGGLTG
jgi:transcriptional regulator with XRE-family HTH domain